MSEELVLEVKGLNLVFDLEFYHNPSLRDRFIRLISGRKSHYDGPTRLHVAKDISFQLRKGDRVGLVGVNGAGKTSLCRCVAGMYRPESGVVVQYGDVRAIFDTQGGIQPELTGRENAHLLTELMFPQLSALERSELVREALDFSELGRFLDVPFRLYSNGMQARLCLSLISSRPTDLLILDEVFDGADAFFREKISHRVVEMIERSGAAILVSHSTDQIRRVCNRVMILNKGQIFFDGPVDDAFRIYDRIGRGHGEDLSN